MTSDRTLSERLAVHGIRHEPGDHGSRALYIGAERIGHATVVEGWALLRLLDAGLERALRAVSALQKIAILASTNRNAQDMAEIATMAVEAGRCPFLPEEFDAAVAERKRLEAAADRLADALAALQTTASNIRSLGAAVAIKTYDAWLAEVERVIGAGPQAHDAEGQT